MKKIMTNIKFKMRYQLNWAAWYLGLYVIVIFLAYFILIKLNILNSSTGSLSYRLWGLLIFQFAVSIKFKDDFDFFISFSNTRNEIFKSLTGSAAGFSLLFSLLIIMEKAIFDMLNSLLGLFVKDFFHKLAPYNTGNLFTRFLFFFLCCMALSATGTLLGSLFYRFGKKFIMVFWILFASVPVLFVTVYFWILYTEKLLNITIVKMSTVLQTFNVVTVSVYLLFLIVFLGSAAYMSIRTLEQK